ncbi:MAG: DUF3574 domain-containing protein [Ferrovibrio sp.]|uniref:DUF3574 domain-containing protein n=1 Tax=Ferrovibrio sp. TaxID=1917215 RepID=UPI00391D148A
MFEEAFLKVGERLGSLQARVVAALVLSSVVFMLLVATAAYAWFNPLALCRQQSSSLFFGTAIADQGRVEAADWDRFVDEVIVPRFPDGFTLLAGQGAWRSSRTGAAVREDSHILLVLHEGDGESDQALDAIAAEYKTRFRQESVLRADQCARYRF